jgi:hypothetical protein
MISQPQPLGIFPFPAGQLLLPDVGDRDRALADAARTDLMAGRTPTVWPAEWAVFAHALAGDRDAALAATQDDSSIIGAYNRFVLDGDARALATVHASADPTLVTLASLAAYVQGQTDDPPSPDGLTGELRANVLLAQAAAAMERHDNGLAARALDQAVTAAEPASPLLAAILLSQRASLPASASEQEACWRRALALAGDSPLPGLLADLRFGLAVVLHQQAETNRSTLVEAVQLYQLALQAGITREDRPELWAQIQSNLGLAFVSMPMSDAGAKLRHAVAIQAFREALHVYTRETHPDAWASTMLNMANAMQYLPSSHPKENLMDAVTAYEELLSVRTRAHDPLGYARILANQGTALAHLGIFAPATEKLTEAHKLLHWYNEADAADQLLHQLEAINVQLSAAEAN